MNRKILVAGAAGAFALATVAIAQTTGQSSAVNQNEAPAAGAYSADTAAQTPSADTAATDTAAAGERG